MTWPSLEWPKAKLSLHCRSISDLETCISSRVHRGISTEGEWRCRFIPRLTASPNFTLSNEQGKTSIAKSCTLDCRWDPKGTGLYILCVQQVLSANRLWQARFSRVDASCKAPGYISVPLHKPWEMLECHFTPVRNGNPAFFNFSMYT